MANPRKFSEKIALHTQKQAEETAAFEAILQEVTSATRLAQFSSQDPPRYQKQHIAPTLGTYRAGSLPNVNQISAKQGIDLQATLQQIDAMKQGKTGIVQSRHDRPRQQIGPHRRNFQPDKRIDSSPYGSAYHLSPPPDTSWRRVHSDPSLHMNAMGNASDNYAQQPMTPPSHRQMVELVGDNAGDNIQMNYWDSKKVNPSRPKSCEVPNINIYPSQEHDCNNSPTLVLSVNSNNTGSLPDLSVLQFPSPLATPLDQEDPYSNVNTGTPVSLSPTSPHHMPLGQQSPQSPGQRRRQTSGIPSPLVLNQIGGPSSPAGVTGMDPCMQQQYMCLLQQQQQQQVEQQRMRHQATHPLTSQPYTTPDSPLFTAHHHSDHQQNTEQTPASNIHQHTSSPTTSTSHSNFTYSLPQLQNEPFTQQMQQLTSQQQHTNQQQQHMNQQQQHVNQQQQQDINQQQHISQQDVNQQQHAIQQHINHAIQQHIDQQQHASQQQHANQQQHVSQQQHANQQHISQQQHASQQHINQQQDINQRHIIQQQHVIQQHINQQQTNQQQQLINQQHHISQQQQTNQPQQMDQQQELISQQQHINQQQTNQQQQHMSQQQHINQQQQTNQQQQHMNQQQQLISQQQHINQQQHSNQQQQTNQQQQHMNQQQQLINQQHINQQQHIKQEQSPLSPPVPRAQNTASGELQSQVSMTQYRNSVSDCNCQSPTSPHSASSYSPVQSPGVGPNNHVADAAFSDSYYIQQQQQTSTLQHQFEQFNMAAFLAMSSSDDFFQPHFLGPIDVMASGHCNSQTTMSSSNNHHMSQHNSLSSPTSSNIPDIILTGADDMYRLPLDFARDLGNAITGLTDSFDADFLTNDEAFKAGLDPLDLEEIQMLTDASLVADPAIEDSFKLDRL